MRWETSERMGSITLRTKRTVPEDWEPREVPVTNRSRDEQMAVLNQKTAWTRPSRRPGVSGRQRSVRCGEGTVERAPSGQLRRGLSEESWGFSP